MPIAVQITDYSNEKSTTVLNTTVLTAGNFTAQQGLAAALVDAIDDLTIGELTKQVNSIPVVDTPAIPTNPYAQREMKWLVQYQGNSSGKMFSSEIAAPDITDNVVPNTDVADLTSTDWAAFKTAFEAYVKSPDDDAEGVTVIGAHLVGRNI